MNNWSTCLSNQEKQQIHGKCLLKTILLARNVLLKDLLQYWSIQKLNKSGFKWHQDDLQWTNMIWDVLREKDI